MAGWSLRGVVLPGALGLCAAIGLSGCASLSEEECLTADWRLLGYEDALRGRSTATISQHRRACAGVSVVPDLELYQQGHQEGARLYCTAANGYRAGSGGSTYQGICPADLETGFLRAYQDGRELYAVTSEIGTLQAATSRNESEIERIRRQIEELEDEIVAEDSTADQRRSKLEEIENLGKRIAEIEVEIAQAQRRLLELELEEETVTREHRLLGY